MSQPPRVPPPRPPRPLARPQPKGMSPRRVSPRGRIILPGTQAFKSLGLEKEYDAIKKAQANLTEKQEALLRSVASIKVVIDNNSDDKLKKKFKKDETSKSFKCKKSKRSKKKVPKKPPKKKPTLSKMMKSTPQRSPKKSKRPRRSKCGGRPKKSRRR